MFGAEAITAMVVAALVSAVVLALVNRLRIAPRSDVPTALIWTAVLIIGSAIVFLLWTRWSRLSTVAGWFLPAALTSFVQSLELHGTPFYLNGTAGDQFFRMQYLQRLTVSPALADDNYAGLPPFYPAGWFWLGGRFAALLGHPAWAAYKPFAILSIGAVSALVFVLWSLITTRRRALGIAAVLAVASLIYGAYEPYRWTAMMLVIAIAALAWRLFRTVASAARPGGLWPATVLVGLGLSVTAAMYTLVFLYGLLLLALLAIAAAVVDRTAGRVWRLGLRLVLIGVVALPLTLLVWAPYLLAVLRQPTAANAAAQVFPIGIAKFGTPALAPTVVGAICLVGLVWVVLAGRRDTVAQAFGVVLAACVVWQLLSTVAIAFGTTLLPSYIAQVGEVALWFGCAFAVADLVEVVPGRWQVGSRGSVRALASVLAVLVAVAVTQAKPRSDLLPAAFAAHRPDTGVPKQVIDTIAQLTRRPPQDNILLTNDYELLDFQPYHGYQTNKEQYANPLARYPDRTRELMGWSRSRTPAEFEGKLTTGEFAPPTVFVFRRDEAGNYPFDCVVTRFPYPNKVHRVTFPAALFDPAHFARRDVGPFTVLARR